MDLSWLVADFWVELAKNLFYGLVLSVAGYLAVAFYASLRHGLSFVAALRQQFSRPRDIATDPGGYLSRSPLAIIPKALVFIVTITVIGLLLVLGAWRVIATDATLSGVQNYGMVRVGSYEAPLVVFAVVYLVVFFTAFAPRIGRLYGVLFTLVFGLFGAAVSIMLIKDIINNRVRVSEPVRWYEWETVEWSREWFLPGLVAAIPPLKALLASLVAVFAVRLATRIIPDAWRNANATGRPAWIAPVVWFAVFVLSLLIFYQLSASVEGEMAADVYNWSFSATFLATLAISRFILPKQNGWAWRAATA